MQVKNTYGPSASRRLIVDTGNLAGKHLISDRTLFNALDESAPSVPIAVANEQIEHTQGDGTCDLITYDKSGNPAGRMILGDCSY